MAFSGINKCEYKFCYQIFPTLHDLITHIEKCHIDFSPEVIEACEDQKVQLLPMSYIIPYKSYNMDKQYVNIKQEIESTSYSKGMHVNGDCSDINYEQSVVKIKNNSDKYSSQYYSPENKIKQEPFEITTHKSKKFSCPITGCTKRYKNYNGMKYHIMNSHEFKGEIDLLKSNKEYKCYCGKEYKTLRGLQSHSTSHTELDNTKIPSRKEYYKMKMSHHAPPSHQSSRYSYQNVFQKDTYRKYLNTPKPETITNPNTYEMNYNYSNYYSVNHQMHKSQESYVNPSARSLVNEMYSYTGIRKLE